MNYLEENDILTDLQHAFRKYRSCESQLILTLQDFAKGLNDSEQIDAILLDFSKAFDTVPHERLLLKLDYYGIRNTTQFWIRDFLSSRTQNVVLEGKSSSVSQVISGVPQGTVLGPLLFLLYINDLPDCVSSTARLFADDCILYRKIKSTEDTIALQQDLNNLQEWEQKWLLSFNPDKCETLHITNKRKPITSTYFIHNKPLSVSETSKYLGININNKLSWNTHIDKITKKANSTSAFIRRNLPHAPRNIKKQCYTTFIRPSLEYASTVWDPHTKCNIAKIEKVQRRAARYIMNDYKRTSSVTDMLNHLSLEPLQSRRNTAKLIVMYKIVHHLISIPPTLLIPTGTITRGHQQRFLIPFSRVSVYRYSFFPTAIRLWNNAPPLATTAVSLPAFKHLISQPM